MRDEIRIAKPTFTLCQALSTFSFCGFFPAEDCADLQHHRVTWWKFCHDLQLQWLFKDHKLGQSVLSFALHTKFVLVFMHPLTPPSYTEGKADAAPIAYVLLVNPPLLISDTVG